MQKTRKDVNIISKVYVKEVVNVFVHPVTCMYVILCQDGFLRVYDPTTMSVVSTCQKRCLPTTQPIECIFSSSLNTFYTLTKSYSIIRYDLSSHGSDLIQCPLSSIPLGIKIIHISKQTYMSTFHILTNRQFIICSLAGLPPLYVEIAEGQVLDGKWLGGRLWILGMKERIMLVEINFHENDIELTQKNTLEIALPPDLKFFIDYKKHLLSFRDQISGLYIVRWNDHGFELPFFGVIPEGRKIQYISYFHFGVSTSTINKFEQNLVLIIRYEPVMEKESETQGFILELPSKENSGSVPIQKQGQNGIYIRNLKQIKKGPWHCQYMENKLSYLSMNGQIEYIDLLCLLESRNVGKEWVNLSYRFEVMEQNEQYEEEQDEFQKSGQDKGSKSSLFVDERPISKEELEDWSQCLFSQKQINQNRITPLNCFQI